MPKQNGQKQATSLPHKYIVIVRGATGTMADKSDLLKKRLGATNAEKELDKVSVVHTGL